MIDKAGTLERVGGDADLLQEIVDLFLTDCPVLLASIRESFQEGDAERLEKTAHALKGSVGNFGADDAVQAALKVETLGRSGDLSEAPVAIQALEKQIEMVREELAAFGKEMAAGA
jgi:HPt (histidine-containing phosphotransfer) domain-containing protein